MDIKGAIEFLEYEKRIECGHATQSKLAKDFNKVITLIRRGEKFEQMWEEFKICFGNDDIAISHGSTNIEELMDDFEQKFFPKEE